MKLLQRLIASTPLSGERIATTLLKHLLLFTILMKTLVSAHADSVNDQLKLEFPMKDHLSARQLYERTYRSEGFAEQIGQFVVLDVVVKIARDVPLVEIERPEKLEIVPKTDVLSAHVITATTEASSWKVGDRIRMEGIVAGEGYGAYTIYLLGYKGSKGLANADTEPSAEDLALVKSLIVKGTVKQSIGSFNGESNRLQIGSTFELDLSNLPKEKIKFTLPPTNPEQRPSNGGYIPFDGPIEIVKVRKSENGRVGAYLSANDSHGNLKIQIVADLPPTKDSWVHVLFYREGIGGFISSSMAEAGGEIMVKDPDPAGVSSKDVKEKSPIRSPEMGPNATPEKVEAAKLQGAETAAQDIKAGVFRILYYGEPYPLKPLVDEATGYRVQIVAGCVVSSQFVAEADAYNQAMRDWHAKNPPPPKP